MISTLGLIRPLHLITSLVENLLFQLDALYVVLSKLGYKPQLPLDTLVEDVFLRMYSLVGGLLSICYCTVVLSDRN